MGKYMRKYVWPAAVIAALLGWMWVGAEQVSAGPDGTCTHGAPAQQEAANECDHDAGECDHEAGECDQAAGECDHDAGACDMDAERGRDEQAARPRNRLWEHIEALAPHDLDLDELHEQFERHVQRLFEGLGLNKDGSLAEELHRLFRELTGEQGGQGDMGERIQSMIERMLQGMDLEPVDPNDPHTPRNFRHLKVYRFEDGQWSTEDGESSNDPGLGPDMHLDIDEMLRSMLGDSEGAAPAPQAHDGLGLSTQPVDEALRLHLDLPRGCGLLVTEVEPGSWAERAGFQTWDVLTEIWNGGCVTEVVGPAVMIEDYFGSEAVEVTVVRRGQSVKLTVPAVVQDQDE